MNRARAAAPRRVVRRRARVLRGAALTVLATWWLLPFVPVLGWAAADRWAYPSPLPTRWGTAGWVAAWQQGAGPALLRSLALGAVVAVVATPLGALAGRGLAARGGRGAAWLAAAVVVPVAVPPFAAVMGLTSLSLRLGVPSVVALVAVLAAAAVPYTTWVMRARWAGYDPAAEEAARTLGASRATVVRRVRWPALAPALATSAFLAFLVAWGDYVATLVLGAGRILTLQQLLGSVAAGSGTEPTLAALAVLTLVPALLLLVAVTALGRGADR